MLRHGCKSGGAGSAVCSFVSWGWTPQRTTDGSQGVLSVPGHIGWRGLRFRKIASQKGWWSLVPVVTPWNRWQVVPVCGWGCVVWIRRPPHHRVPLQDSQGLCWTSCQRGWRLLGSVLRNMCSVGVLALMQSNALKWSGWKQPLVQNFAVFFFLIYVFGRKNT